MRSEVKRWFKIVFCTLMVVFSVSIGFSDWVYPDNSGDKTSGDGKPTQNEIKPCAYIDSNKSVLYTIEDALVKATEKSNKGTTAVNVFVKPGTETTIGNCTITKNVTLTLPYSNETYNEKEFMNIVKDANGDDQVINVFADTNPTLYRKISVKIKSDACLTIANGARLNIGGQNGGTSPQGATTGLYAEVFLQNGASINCSGTIDCLGFIKEESKGGASIVMENQGILHQPLCVYDWGGATAVYKKQGNGLFPFNRFDCPNIRPSITFKKGSTFNCFVHVWGSSAGHFYTNANIISDNDNSFLVLTESSSSIFWHFTDKSDLNVTSKNDSNHLTEINTYSNVNLSKIRVTLNAPVVGEMNIDSSNYYLPVYHGYSIKANSGILSIKYRTKFLPGSKFYVANGATATFSQNAVFYQSNKGQDGNAIPSYSNTTPAVLSNSGIVNVNAGFEGKILIGDGINNSASTRVNVSSSYTTINDCMEGVFNGNILTGKLSKYGPFSFGGATGKILYKQFDETIQSGHRYLDCQNNVFESGKSYILAKKYLINEYGWYSNSDSYISYGTRIHSDLKEFSNPNTNSALYFKKYSAEVEVKSLIPNDPSKYIFNGYYYDSNFATKVKYDTAKKVYLIEPLSAINYIDQTGYLTLYAKWIDKAKLVTVQFRKYDANGNLVNGESYPGSIGDNCNISEFTSSFNDTARTEKVLEDAKISYDFIKWVVRDAGGNEVNLTNNVFTPEEGNSVYYVDPVYSETNWLKYIFMNDKISIGIDYYAITKFTIDGNDYTHKDQSEHEGYVKADNVIYIEKESGWSNKYTVSITFGDGQKIIPLDNKMKKYTLNLSDYKSFFDNLNGPIRIQGKVN